MGERKEKEPKKRAEKYESKVAVKGTFEDIIAASFKPKKKEEKQRQVINPMVI